MIEAYREGLISRGKLGELQGMSFAEREEFLNTRGVPYNYRPEDLQQDIALNQRFGFITRP